MASLRLFRPAPSAPVQNRELGLKVVFTDFAATKAALQTACKLARGLAANITLLDAHVVPYPLPLASPPVPVEFTERSLHRLASEQDVQTTVQVILCRDWWQTTRHVLPANSLVVMGAHQHWWWPNPYERIARLLRRDGHNVILVTI